MFLNKKKRKAHRIFFVSFIRGTLDFLMYSSSEKSNCFLSKAL